MVVKAWLHRQLIVVEERERERDDTISVDFLLWARWPAKIGVFLQEFPVGTLMKPHHAPTALSGGSTRTDASGSTVCERNVSGEFSGLDKTHADKSYFGLITLTPTPHSSGFCSPRSALICSFPVFFCFSFLLLVWMNSSFWEKRVVWVWVWSLIL